MPRPGSSGVGDVHVGADLTPEQVEFGRAMRRYQRDHNLLTLDCRAVLLVAKSLGYRKVARPAERGGR